jgi:hypothetical protein
VLENDGNPNGCSVDPITREVAVANYNTSGYGSKPIGPGDIEIYDAKGNDAHGNLFFESRNYSQAHVSICERRSGGRKISVVPFDHTISGPGSAMWDGRYITFEDSFYATGSRQDTILYRVIQKNSGALMTIGATQFYDSCAQNMSVVQPFIVGTANTPENHASHTIIGYDYHCTNPSLFFWRYPHGGAPFRSLPLPKGSSGNSVSIAKT